jgi:hypothetical protein
MTTRAPFLMTLTALVLTACAMAMSSPKPGGAHQTAVANQAQPGAFSCALVAQARAGGGTRLEGRLTARQALSASYDLQVRGAGVSIDQSGDLSLAAEESTLLGEADLSTAASALDARLTVTANGRTVACPLQRF